MLLPVHHGGGANEIKSGFTVSNLKVWNICPLHCTRGVFLGNVLLRDASINISVVISR